MANWYAIRVEGGRERTVHASLAERDFTCFLPMETRWHTPKWGPREPKGFPLFPGYLFVLCEPEQFADLHGVEGVIAFVRYIREDGAAWPLAFPLAVILNLQIEERAGMYDRTQRRKPRYRPRKGELVKIGAGPYFGFVAKVLATPRDQRCKLLVEGFGSPRRRTEDVAHLSAA